MATSRLLWETVAEQNLNASYRSFLSSTEVWIHRPHVVNRRLLGAAVTSDPLEWSRKEQHLMDGLMSPEECDAYYVRELLPKALSLPSAREVVLISACCGLLRRREEL